MDKAKIDRINCLARKAKSEPLSDAELAEQKALREEYRESFRRNLSGILENTSVKRPDGSIEKLIKK